MKKLVLVTALMVFQPIDLAFAADEGPEETICGKVIQGHFGGGARKSSAQMVPDNDAQLDSEKVVSILDHAQRLKAGHEGPVDQTELMASAKQDLEKSLATFLQLSKDTILLTRQLILISSRLNSAENVMDLKTTKDIREIVHALDVAYSLLVEYLPFFYNPGIEMISGSEVNLVLNEIKTNFVHVHLMLNDPRFAKVLEKLKSKLTPLNSYNLKLLKDYYPTEVNADMKLVDWEFRYPYFKRPTQKYLDESIATIGKQLADVQNSTYLFLRSMGPNQWEAMANPNVKNSYKPFLNGYAKALDVLVSNLEIFAKENFESIPPEHPSLKQIDTFYSLVIDFLEGKQFEEIIAIDAAVEGTGGVQFMYRKSRFESANGSKGVLIFWRTKLRGKG